jgi:hypothetical protein
MLQSANDLKLRIRFGPQYPQPTTPTLIVVDISFLPFLSSSQSSTVFPSAFGRPPGVVLPGTSKFALPLQTSTPARVFNWMSLFGGLLLPTFSSLQITNLHYNSRDRHDEDLEVQGQGLIADILKIEFHHLLECCSILAVDLP